ncbi:hypothetical protein [Nonomuraea jiangxiensis]|uniref:Uncharacterized protein n=1 Tax=Nonomuraea jiangxiensis TaxID=633440 RepID=A0A1G9JHD3_9ACTN|nr:hypothetical protein [Nonomuraea jiangxiensis]SDL36596.1 hypothetical protein SAMN05421869_12533 [Nonomuraea jiangxiensis]
MDAAFFGVLMAIQGAGSVLGGLTAAPVLRRLGPAVMVATALALLGAAGLAMAADLVSVPLLPVAVPALFAAGVAIRSRNRAFLRRPAGARRLSVPAHSVGSPPDANDDGRQRAGRMSFTALHPTH